MTSNNKKTFSLYIKAEKAFDIIIDAIGEIESWILRMTMKIPIVFVSSIRQKATTSLSLKKIRLSISKAALRGKIVAGISLKKIRLVATTKAQVKLITSLVIKLGISASSKLREKFTQTFAVKKISMTLTPIIAAFFTLSDWDSSTLGTLDTDTLGDLDYTV